MPTTIPQAYIKIDVSSFNGNYFSYSVDERTVRSEVGYIYQKTVSVRTKDLKNCLTGGEVFLGPYGAIKNSTEELPELWSDAETKLYFVSGSNHEANRLSKIEFSSLSSFN